MALLCPDVGEVELLSRLLYGRGGTITAATNASPSVLTFSPNCPPAGTEVIISGATGNTAINTTGIIYNVSGATASIATVNAVTGATSPVNGNGVMAGSPVWSMGGVENGTLKLRSDGVTPAESDVAGTYTEATFTGYSSQTLTSQQAAATWGKPSTSAGITKSVYGTVLTWTATSTQTVTGYFVVGATSGTLWWAENFAASQNLASGITLNLTAQIQLD